MTNISLELLVLQVDYIDLRDALVLAVAYIALEILILKVAYIGLEMYWC